MEDKRKHKRDDIQIEPVKVIARYINVKVLKGHTHDFFPNKHIFRIYPSIDEPLKEGTEIQNRLGFFLFPADPQSNNLRDFVICIAVRNVRYL